jgi:hypothetical protein
MASRPSWAPNLFAAMTNGYPIAAAISAGGANPTEARPVRGTYSEPRPASWRARTEQAASDSSLNHWSSGA